MEAQRLAVHVNLMGANATTNDGGSSEAASAPRQQVKERQLAQAAAALLQHHLGVGRQAHHQRLLARRLWQRALDALPSRTRSQ